MEEYLTPAHPRSRTAEHLRLCERNKCSGSGKAVVNPAASAHSLLPTPEAEPPALGQSSAGHRELITTGMWGARGHAPGTPVPSVAVLDMLRGAFRGRVIGFIRSQPWSEQR